jgi:hypothetical protein
LNALRMSDLRNELRERAEPLRRRGLLIEQLRELENQDAQVGRMLNDALDALRPMYAFFLQLPAPPPDLYFPGQERIS